MKYRAVYEREPDGRWTVEIPEVPGCHTYGRTIDQARERLREALSLFKDNADRAEFIDEVKLPAGVSQTLRAAKISRAALAEQERKVMAAQVKAAVRLRELKFGYRDAGELLGLSYQRVQQLVEQEHPLVHGAVISKQAHPRRHYVRRMAAKKR